MNSNPATWALIALLSASSVHGCRMPSRFSPLSFETLRTLDPRLNRETLKDFDDFTRILNEALGTSEIGTPAGNVAAVYDPTTSRLVLIGGVQSDWQRVDQVIQRALFLRAIHRICLPASTVFLVLSGSIIFRKWRGKRAMNPMCEGPAQEEISPTA